MPPKHWILVDSRQGIYEEAFAVEKNSYRISKHRLRGGLSDSVDVVVINNGKLSLTVLPTRGMGIWRGRCGDVELKWDSPVTGPVHPSLVPLFDPGGLGELNIPCGMGMQEISFGYFNMLYSFIDPNISDKDLATIYPFNYPGYKDGVRFINKCYNEGLISPEFALDTDCSKMWTDIQNGYVGGYMVKKMIENQERQMASHQ